MSHCSKTTSQVSPANPKVASRKLLNFCWCATQIFLVAVGCKSKEEVSDYHHQINNVSLIVFCVRYTLYQKSVFSLKIPFPNKNYVLIILPKIIDSKMNFNFPIKIFRKDFGLIMDVFPSVYQNSQRVLLLSSQSTYNLLFKRLSSRWL